MKWLRNNTSLFFYLYNVLIVYSLYAIYGDIAHFLLFLGVEGIVIVFIEAMYKDIADFLTRRKE